ncbi:hypothetical protein ACLVWU_10480 [Bdellovibrio sp. HCB290]|uniref:hypothetical protein n=1 Tax=Bdellovibrio sp. HCB290 TaxID=3394356 RepID=UPI0039B5A317
MFKSNDLNILSFPWNGELPTSKQILLRDIDVVGVGAIRKAQLLNIQADCEFILQKHSAFIPASVRNIYDEELKRTLNWLNPVSEIEVLNFDFNTEVMRTFERSFPKTHQYLGVMLKPALELYLKEMEWSSWLLQDHWRYFSGFIRQKYPENKVLHELTQWEWIHAWLEIQPFESEKNYGKQITVNSSLQVLALPEGNTKLQREKGLYTFVYDQDSVKIAERKLDIYEAALLDLLAEDRIYTEEQLLEMASLEEIEPAININEWIKRIEVLLASAVLVKC